MLGCVLPLRELRKPQHNICAPSGTLGGGQGGKAYLIRLSPKTQAFSPKSTFPRGEGLSSPIPIAFPFGEGGSAQR